MSTPLRPYWPHCGHGADPATDPIGCRGVHVPGNTACLAHLTDTERTAYLTGLTPGTDIDHRGTPFTQQLLEALLNALNDPSTGAPNVGQAGFEGARFSGNADFGRARFSGNAHFDGAQFSDYAGFRGAQFSGNVGFGGAQFSGATRFDGAQFMVVPRLGPLVCQKTVFLSRARFGVPVSVEVAAARVVCDGTSWDAKATLRLRYAALDLTDAVMDYPLRVTAKAAPFLTNTTPFAVDVPEGGLARAGRSAPANPAAVRVVALSGADAAHLALHNVDLAECRFFGTIHLDQLRLEGQCPLAPPPLADGGPAGAPWPRSTTGAPPGNSPAGWQPPTEQRYTPQRHSRRSTGSCASRSRTARTSRTLRTSTTAR